MHPRAGLPLFLEALVFLLCGCTKVILHSDRTPWNCSHVSSDCQLKTRELPSNVTVANVEVCLLVFKTLGS